MSDRDPEPDDFELPDDAKPPRVVRSLELVLAIVRGHLGAGGTLSQVNPGHEERAVQLQMAAAVAQGLSERRHVVVEAGTGTGKTLGYLVPALESVTSVTVSTATKALQEQLVQKDLPLLQSLGMKFRFAVMKGRSNYLCHLRREHFEEAPQFVSLGEKRAYPKLRAWAERTETGDRAELDLPDNYAAWREVSSTSESCVGQECPHYETCFVVRMREKAKGADVVVVNHHLYFADLALRQSASFRPGIEIVPRTDAVIFDEAHNIEEIATDFLGAQVSNYRFYDLCRDIDRAVGQRTDWAKRDILAATSVVGSAVDGYFNRVAALAPRQESRFEKRPPTPIVVDPPSGEVDLFAPKADRAPEDEVLARAIVVAPIEHERTESRWAFTPGALDGLAPERGALNEALTALRKTLFQSRRKESEPELDTFERRAEDLALEIDRTAGAPLKDVVYWASTRGKGVFLRASPVDVAATLQAALFGQGFPVILTSATIATGGKTDFFRRRIGLGVESETGATPIEAVLASPFDYTKQAAIYLPRHLPEPNAPDFLEKAENEVAALIALAKGRTFVLCTSHRAMQELHRRLGSRLPYQVLLQGERPKGALLKAFVEQPSVLFATQSFWEGVDVPGDALSMVIIDKLPFASPTEPLVAARMAAIDDRGGSSFSEYSMPAAAIALKQGFGRLIRSTQDTGAVAILDRRVWTKSYGSFFRKTLPPCPTFERFPDLKDWWRNVRKHEEE